jgi:hypothetical protein
MEFVLMRLTFSDPPSGESSSERPVFSRVTDFKTTGVVMNIFLLDPSERLLSAFVWVASSNTIGLYALLDWSKPEYTFIETGIDYVCSFCLFFFLCLFYNFSRPCRRTGHVFSTTTTLSSIAKNLKPLINTSTPSLSSDPTLLIFPHGIPILKSLVASLQHVLSPKDSFFPKFHHLNPQLLLHTRLWRRI